MFWGVHEVERARQLDGKHGVCEVEVVLRRPGAVRLVLGEVGVLLRWKPFGAEAAAVPTDSSMNERLTVVIRATAQCRDVGELARVLVL